MTHCAFGICPNIYFVQPKSTFSWTVFCPPSHIYIHNPYGHKVTILLKPRTQALWVSMAQNKALCNCYFKNPLLLCSYITIANYTLALQGHCIISPDPPLYSGNYFFIPNLGNEIFLPSVAFVISKLNGKLHKCIGMKFLLFHQCFAKGCKGITH